MKFSRKKNKVVVEIEDKDLPSLRNELAQAIKLGTPGDGSPTVDQREQWAAMEEVYLGGDRAGTTTHHIKLSQAALDKAANHTAPAHTAPTHTPPDTPRD